MDTPIIHTVTKQETNRAMAVTISTKNTTVKGKDVATINGTAIQR
jgi:hypothetical protein